jgi:hypothetical protein
MASVVEKSELLRRKVRDAVLLFEHKEGSKQVDLKDIGTLVRRREWLRGGAWAACGIQGCL